MAGRAAWVVAIAKLYATFSRHFASYEALWAFLLATLSISHTPSAVSAIFVSSAIGSDFAVSGDQISYKAGFAFAAIGAAYFVRLFTVTCF